MIQQQQLPPKPLLPEHMDSFHLAFRQRISDGAPCTARLSGGHPVPSSASSYAGGGWFDTGQDGTRDESAICVIKVRS